MGHHVHHSSKRRHHHSKSRLRPAAFILIATGVFALAIYFLKSDFFKPELPAMAGNVIEVKADMSGFDQKEIHVKAGEAVTIRLTSLDNSAHSDGGGKHQWAVDTLGVNIIAPPNGSSYATFTPDKPGEFTFYCDICCGGKANPQMNGKLIVEG